MSVNGLAQTSVSRNAHPIHCFYLQVIHECAAVYDEARHDDGGDDELELGGLGAGVAPPFPEQADHDRVELIHPLAWKLNV